MCSLAWPGGLALELTLREAGQGRVAAIGTSCAVFVK